MIRKKYYTGEQIIEVLHEFCNDYDEALGMLNRFACLETADVEPIRHGEWIHREYRLTNGDAVGFYECSECGCASWIKEHKYCSTCGAKMDKGEGTHEID